MPLGMEVDLGPGHVLDGVPTLREGGTAAPSFRPMSIVATIAHLSYCWAFVWTSEHVKWTCVQTMWMHFIQIAMFPWYCCGLWWANLKSKSTLRSQIFPEMYLDHLARSQMPIFPEVPSLSSEISNFSWSWMCNCVFNRKLTQWHLMHYILGIITHVVTVHV